MQYKKFLKIISAAFLASGVVGLTVLGPTPNSSVLGSHLYFDQIQSIIHLLLAAITFGAYHLRNEDVQRYITAGIGVLAITITVFSFYRLSAPSPNAYVANIEPPLESLIYLGIGLWALWVVLMPPGPLFVKEDDSE